jgi:hypothetical protein
METFPVPLDTMITFVKTLRPDGGPLDNLTDAVVVGTRLDEQADALIGHFVDQARRSGASWSEIGAHMGVSKQAAQKRFVPRFDAPELPPAARLYARFTDRARHVLLAAAELAGPTAAIDADQLAVGLLVEPDGLATRIMHAIGIADQQIAEAFGLPLASGAGGTVTLDDLHFTAAGTAALEGAVRAALRLGHDYIGTEHELLGILMAQGDAATKLTALGLTVDLVEAAVREQLTTLKKGRRQGRPAKPR